MSPCLVFKPHSALTKPVKTQHASAAMFTLLSALYLMCSVRRDWQRAYTGVVGPEGPRAAIVCSSHRHCCAVVAG